MASSAVSSSAPKIPQSRQELRQTLADKTVETMKMIAANNLLGKGVQYPEDYLGRMKREKGAIPNEYLGLPVCGSAPKKFFQRAMKDRIYWIIKPDVPANVALEAAIMGPTLVDCGIACTLALHKSLLNAIGPDRYNKIFNGRLFLVADPTIPDPMGLFTRSVRVNKIGKGTLVGFNNVEAYAKKHPRGLWGSFNMCCIGDNRYVGLGTSENGLTEPEIKELLAKEFNKAPLSDGIIPKEDSKDNGQQIQAKDVPGMDPDFIQDFNLDMVEKVLNTKLEDLSFDALVAWRRAHPPK